MEFTVHLILAGVLIWVAFTLNRTARIVNAAAKELSGVNDALHPVYCHSEIDAQRIRVQEQRLRVEAKTEIRDEALNARNPPGITSNDEERFKNVWHEEIVYAHDLERLRFLIEANMRVRSAVSTFDR